MTRTGYCSWPLRPSFDVSVTTKGVVVDDWMLDLMILCFSRPLAFVGWRGMAAYLMSVRFVGLTKSSGAPGAGEGNRDNRILDRP